MITRRAIDIMGRLGSLYDIRRDCVLEKQDVKCPIVITPDRGLPQHDLIDGATNESKNILKKIGLDYALRLKILLKLIPRDGIAQLMDYPHPVDKYTRFLYISYTFRQEQLPNHLHKEHIRPKSPDHNPNATHFITAINYGVDIVVVLQLPSKDNIASQIDTILHKIRMAVKDKQDFPTLEKEEVDLLKRTDRMTVYSNMKDLLGKTSLVNICDYITELKRNSEKCPPRTYILKHIEHLYPDHPNKDVRYIPIEERCNPKMEQYLLDILKQLKRTEYKMNSLGKKTRSDDLKTSLIEATGLWDDANKMYDNLIQELREIVLALQNDPGHASKIDSVLEHDDQKTLEKNLRQLIRKITDIEHQTDGGSRERNDLFDDHNSSTPAVTQTSQPISPKQNVMQNEQTIPVTTSEDQQTGNQPNRTPSPSDAQDSNQTPDKTTYKIINVLLLGESGVGKSTFINAFINYLVFQTLQQAESARPVVLIPVSFLLTTGDNFQEHTVNFGDTHTFYNEDFDHPGQSVTQQCRSYLFCVDPHKRVKFRLIDTPGFGDTRGIDQDDLNMQHILEYINQYDHFNAVCFLLKPNTSQINSFFRVCLNQLLDLLGPHIRQNIIFCFTSARSTFYTPGDTAPLLKEILRSLATKDVPFKKKNTFCFDNESFRYLVALQNSINFDELDRQEYELSWIKSVDESKRLFQYIDEDLSPCYRKDDYRSMRRAEIEIKSMVRPILESIRNTIRSIVLYDHSPNKSIELCPKPLARPATMCLGCKRRLAQKGQFWIVEDVLHQTHKRCDSCECSPNQHRPITYILKYKYSDQSRRQNRKQMEDQRNELVFASAMFACFLLNIARSSKDDPFLTGLIQMIDEENDIRKRQKRNEMNVIVVGDLIKRLSNYENRVEEFNLSARELHLSAIYKRIQAVCEYEEVKVQMDTIKRTQEMLMKLFEYEVSDNSIKSSIYPRTMS